MEYTPGRNYGHTVAAAVERLRAAGLHESIPCMDADTFLASGVVPAVKCGRAYRKKKSSRYFGVTRKANGKIYAQINRKNHKWFPSRPFDTEIEAHIAVLNELKRFEEAAA